jgi:hypothetical protein
MENWKMADIVRGGLVVVAVLLTGCISHPDPWIPSGESDQRARGEDSSRQRHVDSRGRPLVDVQADTVGLETTVPMDILPDLAATEIAAEIPEQPDIVVPDLLDLPDLAEIVDPPDLVDVTDAADISPDVVAPADVADVPEDIPDLADAHDAALEVEDVAPEAEICAPDCDGKECGDDGCGNVCGTCDIWSSLYCEDFSCLCKLAPQVDIDKVNASGDDDYCYSVVESPAGDYVLGGDSYGSSIVREMQIWRAWASNGNQRCYMYLPGDGTNRVRAMHALDDGRVVLTGTYSKKISNDLPTKWDYFVGFTKDSADYSCHIEKDNIKYFGTSSYEQAYDIEPLPGNSGYVITGYRQTGADWDQKDIWTITTDAEGNPNLPGTQYGGDGHEEGHSVAVTADGFVVAGFTNEGGDGYDALLVKFSPAGETVWERKLAPGAARGIVALEGGGFAVAGYALGEDTGKDFHLWVTDSAGEILYDGEYGGAGDEDARAIAIHPSGGFVLAGESTTDASGGQDGLIVRFTATGAVQWAKGVGGGAMDYPRSVIVDSDGRIVMSGYKEHASNPANKTDFWFVRLAAECL